MKITFNPTIKNYQTNYKPLKSNFAPMKSYANINGLDCLANYNLSFGTRAIYAINYDGSYERFESAKEAANGGNQSKIIQTLQGKSSCSDGKVYVYADDLELPNGEIGPKALNMALLNFKNAQNQPIYAIDLYGNTQRFNSVKNASAVLKIGAPNIIQVLNQSLKSIGGYTFIKAFDVELRNKNGKLLKDENNNPIFDVDKMNKLREVFIYAGGKYPVVAIDKQGNAKIYKNTKEAGSSLNIKNVAQCVCNESVAQGKYFFTRLSNVVMLDKFGDVVFDKNNDFVIDYDKVEEFRQMAFGG